MSDAAYEYIVITTERPRKGRKTPTYRIWNRRGEMAIIGRIRWYGPWRQFCFFPCADTAWSDGCLADVRNFLGRLKAQRAARRTSGAASTAGAGRD